MQLHSFLSRPDRKTLIEFRKISLKICQKFNFLRDGVIGVVPKPPRSKSGAVGVYIPSHYN
jgi:hypothetical protein